MRILSVAFMVVCLAVGSLGGWWAGSALSAVVISHRGERHARSLSPERQAMVAEALAQPVQSYVRRSGDTMSGQLKTTRLLSGILCLNTALACTNPPTGSQVGWYYDGTYLTAWYAGAQRVFFNNGSGSASLAVTSLTVSNGIDDQATAGTNAFAVDTNGARIDFGAGANDYASSDGTTVTFAGPIATTRDFVLDKVSSGIGAGSLLAVGTNYSGWKLPAAWTLTHTSMNVTTASTATAANTVITYTDGTNTCTATFACNTVTNTTGVKDVAVVNGAGTGCVYAASALVTFSVTTQGCATAVTTNSITTWGKPQ